MVMDVDGDNDEGDNTSLTAWDKGDNRNRDNGEDACAQPFVRRWYVERRKRCKEM
jgi:hypothetical protein